MVRVDVSKTLCWGFESLWRFYMTGHSKTICKICNEIIKQCKCMDKNKTTIFDICDKCKKEQLASQLKELYNKGKKML